ncbi:MAG: hypothetical protein M3295_07845 [Chloroflexota bacterium]|nr:hypothetical protein [Chloroflexota bacterium]
MDPKARCDWSGCRLVASQVVVLPQRTVRTCPEHTRRLAIAHREGLEVNVDPLYVPHPLTRPPARKSWR